MRCIPKKVVPDLRLWFGICFFTSLGRLPFWQPQLIEVASIKKAVVRNSTQTWCGRVWISECKNLPFPPSCAWEATLKVTPFGACSRRTKKRPNCAKLWGVATPCRHLFIDNSILRDWKLESSFVSSREETVEACTPKVQGIWWPSWPRNIHPPLHHQMVNLKLGGNTSTTWSFL